MRAARYHARQDVRVDDIPIPELKDDEVLVAVEWCGICGTDLFEYTSGPAAIPKQDRPHSITNCVLPVTMGHEFCGRVARVNKASNLQVGDPVMVDPRLYCGSCTSCSDAATNRCSSWGFLGISGGGGGGFSEFVAVHKDKCFALPNTASLETAALLEPITVAWHAIKIATLKSETDSAALIIGAGPVGLAMILALRARGVPRIYISEPTPERRRLAGTMADNVLNPVTDNVGKEVMRLAGGSGVNAVFDCAGVQSGFDSAMQSIAFGGVYVNLAAWKTELKISQGVFMRKELSYSSSFSYTDQDFREVVDAFIDGKFPNLESLVTSRVHLDDIVKQGFEQLVFKPDQHAKILVTPNKPAVGL